MEHSGMLFHRVLVNFHQHHTKNIPQKVFPSVSKVFICLRLFCFDFRKSAMTIFQIDQLSSPYQTQSTANTVQFSRESFSQGLSTHPFPQASRAHVHSCIPDPGTSIPIPPYQGPPLRGIPGTCTRTLLWEALTEELFSSWIPTIPLLALPCLPTS